MICPSFPACTAVAMLQQCHLFTSYFINPYLSNRYPFKTIRDIGDDRKNNLITFSSAYIFYIDKPNKELI